jgi:L-threonylcarbamoyladenylate synthase
VSGAAYIGLDPPRPGHALARTRVCAGLAEYAHELFAFFRVCDADRIPLIYCQRVPPIGLGAAINDRIMRAEAAFFSLEE